MANWIFNESHYEERDFSIIPEGNHRMRVSDVTEKTFRSGNAGYEIVFEVSGYSSKIWYYLVLNPAEVEQTNQRIGAFFASFGINDVQRGNGKNWIGKVGAAYVKHEPYNGKESAKIRYFLNKKKQETLPPWQDKAATTQPQPQGFVEVNPDDLPFM